MCNTNSPASIFQSFLLHHKNARSATFVVSLIVFVSPGFKKTFSEASSSYSGCNIEQTRSLAYNCVTSAIYCIAIISINKPATGISK